MHYNVMVLLPRQPDHIEALTVMLEGLLDPFNENEHRDELVHDPEYPGEDYYTNPNGEWDWWMLGGRWAGLLHVQDGSPSHALGLRYSADYPIKTGTDEDKRSPLAMDAARWGDMDFTMCRADVGMRAIDSWHAAEEHEKQWGRSIRGLYGIPPEIATAADYAAKRMAEWEFSTFAMLAEGTWASKGWKDDDEQALNYGRMQRAMLAKMPPEQWIAIVDCHV